MRSVSPVSPAFALGLFGDGGWDVDGEAEEGAQAVQVVQAARGVQEVLPDGYVADAAGEAFVAAPGVSVTGWPLRRRRRCVPAVFVGS